jgi:WD40 repeat protein
LSLRLPKGSLSSPTAGSWPAPGKEGLARVWSTADQTEVAVLIGHEGAVDSVVFSPDGKRLVTGGSDDFTIPLWDLPPVCWVVK